MPFIDTGLVQELNLDGSPNSLQRVELAMHQRYTSHAELVAAPADLDSLVDYLLPIFERYGNCTPDPSARGVLHDLAGVRVDLYALIAEVFTRGNGQVLFMACYKRLSCLPQN